MIHMSKEERLLKEELDSVNGILRLAPAFVPRTSYPGMGRLGLRDYFMGPRRGWICERWLASSVEADNPIKVEDEGLSFIKFTSGAGSLLLREALQLIPGRLLGDRYAREHDNRFGVLTKVLDIGAPIPWHIHAGEEDAKKYWKMNGKEEAYYFLDTEERGPLPYSHLAVHPDVTEEDLLLILKRWNDDEVLDLSPAYRLNIGEGFHVFPGVTHAPGTALTLEAQEESDVFNMLQAVCDGRRTPKEDMLRGLPDEETVVKLIDWEKIRDPLFYSKYHTVPEKIDEPENEGQGIEFWVFNPNRTHKFCGKEVRVFPGKTMESVEKGAYAVFVWKGEGKVGDVEVLAGDPDMDELFVSAEAATQSHEMVNTGKEELVLYKMFGPDVYKAPIIYDSI
jgi:mannose-6-phosphate isomerase class I